VGWLSWFTTLCRTDYEPRQDGSDPDKELFVTLDAVERLEAFVTPRMEHPIFACWRYNQTVRSRPVWSKTMID
jgi:hypothetical protein